jgi:hypothetical protein
LPRLALNLNLPDLHFLNSWDYRGEPLRLALLYTDVHSFEYMPRGGIAGSYGSFSFNFLRPLHTDSHSG